MPLDSRWSLGTRMLVASEHSASAARKKVGTQINYIYCLLGSTQYIRVTGGKQGENRGMQSVVAQGDALVRYRARGIAGQKPIGPRRRRCLKALGALSCFCVWQNQALYT